MEYFRYNYEATDENLLVCYNNHQKESPCEFVKLCPHDALKHINEMRSAALESVALRAHLEHAESHVKCQTEENYLLADCMCLEYHENLAIRARVARLEGIVRMLIGCVEDTKKYPDIHDDFVDELDTASRALEEK